MDAVEDGTSENNRRAKFYRLTPRGRKRLAVETSEWDKLAGAIARICGRPNRRANHEAPRAHVAGSRRSYPAAHRNRDPGQYRPRHVSARSAHAALRKPARGACRKKRAKCGAPCGSSNSGRMSATPCARCGNPPASRRLPFSRSRSALAQTRDFQRGIRVPAPAAVQPRSISPRFSSEPA